MSTQTIASTQRRPWLAVLLSMVLPGLGQLYCGATIKCLWVSGLMSAIGILSILSIATPLSASHRPLIQTSGSLLLLCLVLSLVVYGFSVIDALLTARKTREDYRLKDYNRWYAYLLFWIAVSGGYLFAALYVRETQLEAFKVPGASMYPAIWPGDRLLAAKNVYLDHDPAIGDVVIFRNPENRAQAYIKRVVAVEGDTVEIRDDDLYINGVKLRREEASAPANVAPQVKGTPAYFYEWNGNAKYQICLCADGGLGVKDFPKTIVPKHQCFVLGDNREDSMDSRVFGSIPIVGIIGKASFIYEPSEDWSRFGSME
ncbi:MAG: signal peptidase I [Tepidisphaeraceae bacterium]